MGAHHLHMAASAPWGTPRSFSHRACRHSRRAASTCVSSSASGCETPWKAESGVPKASRRATQAQVSSSAARATASTCRSISARETPGVSSGIRSAVTPRAPDSGVPVRPNTTAASAWSAAEIEVFSPFST